jgi:hypothetical protein
MFGKDTLFGGSGFGDIDGVAYNYLSGDLGVLLFPDSPADPSSGMMSGNVQGGDDTLYGGKTHADNLLFGDAYRLEMGARGGDDTLIGGDAQSLNSLIGDAEYIDSSSRGGNDRLISGAGDDLMWGDARVENSGIGGADRFVFASGNGQDQILDFRLLEGDKIDLKAFKGLATDLNGDGLKDFNNFSALVASGRITLADVDGDFAVDDIVINTGLSPTSGFQIAVIGNFQLSDVTAAWFLL